MRFYEPGVGRFSQRDPIRRYGWSPYPYADDIPVLATDPSGKLIFIPVLFGLAGLGLTGLQLDCVYTSFKQAEQIENYGYDKLAHCYFACRAKRCLITGRCRAFDWVAKKLMWKWEDWFGVKDPKDVTAGEIGLQCGSNHGLRECKGCCERELVRRGIGTGYY